MLLLMLLEWLGSLRTAWDEEENVVGPTEGKVHVDASSRCLCATADFGLCESLLRRRCHAD